MGKKVIVGLSGGVDSSVAAYVLMKQGYEVIGVTMHVWNQEGDDVYSQAVYDAKKVAEHLGIPHHVIDFTKEFKEKVVDYFIGEYMAGRTPNPCNMCNRFVKWVSPFYKLELLNKKGEKYNETCIGSCK